MPWLAGHGRLDDQDNDNLGVDWVLQYEFGEIDQIQAIAEFRSLVDDLHEAGIRLQVRHGHGTSLLVFIHVPRDHLGQMIHKSRIKDWLFGITHSLPVGDQNATAPAETPAEEVRSVYHAVTWPKELGGAGITPKHGRWANITASFALHDQDACSRLLRKWSCRTALTTQDIDKIRALFGEKVAFYFAFTQCYSHFLIFPALLALCTWMYLGPYSTIYGGALSIWCIVFVEYWKIREADLSQRWGVKGVGRLKENRTQFQWEKEFRDPVSGQAIRVFPRWKQFLRQLLLIPFASVASIALSGLTCATFAGEVFISQVYNGPLHVYFKFVPTILFALLLPAITSFLTGMAARLTDYENYRTQGQYDLAQTQKAVLMNSITSTLPTLLTAYVYVPFAKSIIPYLNILHQRGWTIDIARAHRDFQVDNSRFQQQVIILSMTAQVLSLCEEIILPYAEHILSQKWRTYRLHQTGLTHKPSVTKPTNLLRTDAPEEASFLRRVRNEADADEYTVAQNTLELCIQFGYLSLFGVSWPLLPLAFLLTNWLKLRGDIFKLTLASQRPPPLRTDSIGPCLTGLELLAWIGTLCTAAIAYIYRRPIPEVHLSSLLITIFLAEQAYLAIRFTAASVFKEIFADILHAEDTHRYAVRKSILDARMARPGTPGSPGSGSGPRVSQRVRFHERVNVYSSSDTSSSPNGSPVLTSERSYDEALRGSDREAEFWNASLRDAADVGVEIIRALGGCQVELQDQMEWLKKA